MELNIETINLYKNIEKEITNKANDIIKEYTGNYCHIGYINIDENISIEYSDFNYDSFISFNIDDFTNLSAKQLSDNKKEQEKIKKDELKKEK